MEYNYKIIRSSRRTISLEVGPKGIVVRAPMRMSERDIRKFVDSHREWIEKRLRRLETARESVEPLSAEEIRRLAKAAAEYIPRRVQHYAPMVGVSYGRITIRCQKTRWGSCSAEGNLNFNCLLMLAPPDVIDSVVVHELCHRLEMNHSDRFYAEVYRVFPDYDRCHKWLKDNGAALLMRAGKL